MGVHYVETQYNNGVASVSSYQRIAIHTGLIPFFAAEEDRTAVTDPLTHMSLAGREHRQNQPVINAVAQTVMGLLRLEILTGFRDVLSAPSVIRTCAERCTHLVHYGLLLHLKRDDAVATVYRLE